MDVLGAASGADDITWWENDGNESFTENTIAGNFNGANSVYATDVDGDGDMDALGSALIDDDITWWQQTDAVTKTVTFTDGSSFNPSITKGQPHQAIGRFQLTASETFSLVSAKIKLNGTRSGASDFRLWQSSDNTFSSSSDIQLGSMVAYDPGTGQTITFDNFASPISSSGTYYFLTCDVASDATGSIQGVLVQSASLVYSGGTLDGSISNAVLSGGDASLPVELTSFTARQEGKFLMLKWVTESELDNLGFILERRTIADSSAGWVELANYLTHSELQGQGSVTTRTDYYIRIRQSLLGIPMITGWRM
jgi:hypothetical protein